MASTLKQNNTTGLPKPSPTQRYDWPFAKLPLDVACDPDLSPGEKALFALVGYWAGEDGIWGDDEDNHTSTRQFIAEQLGCNHDSVAAYAKKLVDRRVMECEQIPDSSRYLFHFLVAPPATATDYIPISLELLKLPDVGFAETIFCGYVAFKDGCRRGAFSKNRTIQADLGHRCPRQTKRVTAKACKLGISCEFRSGRPSTYRLGDVRDLLGSVTPLLENVTPPYYDLSPPY